MSPQNARAADPLDLRAPVLSPGWLRREWPLRIGVAAAGLMFVVPFLVPGKAMPIPSFWAETFAIVLGLIALMALVSRPRQLQLPRIAWMPAAFALLILLQTACGYLAYYQQGLLAVLLLIWTAGLMVLGGLLRREVGLDATVQTLAWFFLAGALISALIGLMQVLDSYPVPRVLITPASKERVWANLAQPNHLANYLTAGLVSIGYLYSVGRLRSVYTFAAALLIIYVLILTGGRAPWVYLSGFALLSLAFWQHARDAGNRRLLVFSFVVLVTFVALPHVAYWLLSTLEWAATPFLTRMSAAQFAAEERPGLAYAAWRMFTAQPLFGVGFRQYAIHYFRGDDFPPPRVLGFNDHAHNIVLQVMAEFGLAGLLVLAAGTLPWLLGLFRQQRSPALWWIVAFTSIVIIHSLLEYPLWYAYFLGPTALVLGLGEARTLSFKLWPTARLGWSLAAAAILLSGWLVTAQTVRDYIALENFLGFRYRYLHASQDLGPKAAEMLHEVGRASLLYPYVDLGRARVMHVDAGALHDKLAVNGRALRAFPIDDVAFRQAMLMALAGDLAGAQLQWNRAAAQYPPFERDALLVLHRRVEDGLIALAPLEQHAAHKH